MGEQNLVQTVIAAGQFKMLASLLTKAGLAGTLEGNGPLTVFVPTDATFAKVRQATLAALAKNKAKLRAVPLYYVVKGKVTAAQAMKLHPRDQQGADPLIPDRVLERSQVVPVDVDEAFAFFADARNLERITPPWLRFRILEAPRTLERGSLLVYGLRLFGVPIRWRTEIVEWRPPFGFIDVQLMGPYRRWEHTHRLRRVDGGTEISDHVVYRLPYEPLAGVVAPVTVRPWLAAIFDYRARQIEASLR